MSPKYPKDPNPAALQFAVPGFYPSSWLLNGHRCSNCQVANQPPGRSWRERPASDNQLQV